MARARKNLLVGKFFHSVREDRETIQCQGVVEAEVGLGLFLVQLFDWLIGAPHDQLVVPVSDTKYWKFYDCADDMGLAYKEYAHRRECRERRTMLAEQTGSATQGE